VRENIPGQAILQLYHEITFYIENSIDNAIKPGEVRDL